MSRFSRLYVFGDSYSDIGAGYFDSNGPTAVAYLAAQWKLPFTHSKDPDANRQSIDFAVSGARTGEGEGIVLPKGTLGIGMINQVRNFVARVESSAVKFDPDTTLFFIAGGLNDDSLPTEATVANLSYEIELLRSAGARLFTVALLPTKIPGFAEVGLRLNPALRGLVGDFQRQGLAIALNQWGPDFDQVLDHASRYGITNTASPCAGRELFGENPTPRGDPETFYYFHLDHPSAHVHRVVGAMLAHELANYPPAN